MASNPEPALRVPSSRGVTVAVHDLGGEGPPLLVAHANGFCGGAYGPLARELAEHRHVWALDFRGQGQSTPPNDLAFDWGGLADDVLAAIDALGGGPLDVVGHSMGGGGLLRAETRRPGTIRRAYLFEPIVLPDGLEVPAGRNMMAEGARRRRETYASRADALWSYARRPPLGFLRADALAAYVEHGFEELEDGSARLRCRAEHEARMFEASGTTITTHDLGAVTVPVTVGVGVLEEGWGGPARFAPAVADALPNGRLSEHPLLGHFGPLENPPVIAADILATLDG